MSQPCEFCTKNCGRPWCYTNQKKEEKPMKLRKFKTTNWLGRSIGMYIYRNKVKTKWLDCGIILHFVASTYGLVLTF